ncbi:MAG: thiamine pyrophosphate-binding protein [Negativicutes bacterium]
MAKMRVADYITDALYRAGGETVFLVTGGMIMHLTDALLVHGKQKYICCHHEQAVAMAAEAYGRYSGRLGVAYVTAGPGALNAITGVVGALVDTSPCIVVSGQSKVSQAVVRGPRQFALQGYNNIELFKPITKYAVMIERIDQVKYEIQKAISIALQPRVGPVYVECPIDIQGAEFDPDDYKDYDESEDELLADVADDKFIEIAKLISESKRPIIIAGAGVRLSGAINELHSFAEKADIPILTSRLGMDLIGDDHRLFVGRPGTYGDRPANFAVQNCDLLISVGCRLGIGLTGYDYDTFATQAIKVIIDIDETELNKPGVKADIALQIDAKEFFQRIDRYSPPVSKNADWLDRVRSWRKRYPVDLPEYLDEKNGINSYHFTRVFSEHMADGGVFVCDTGSCFHVYAQAFKVKFGQRHIITGGLSTMGYMPGAIGVAADTQGASVYCITGDGSLQMNIQELQTIVHNKLSIKLIVFNNDGYLLIRTTQKNFQAGRYMGESSSTGVSFPDLQKLANAYGIKYLRITSETELDKKLIELSSFNGAVICEVITPREQLLIPRVASKQLPDGTMVSMAYDDMFPFLPREEYLADKKF